MLTSDKRLQLVFQSEEFVRKLQRVESLSIQLSKLTGTSTFELISDTYSLEVSWSNYGSGLDGVGHDEVTYVTLKQRKKCWIFTKRCVVMQYQRNYGHSSRKEERHMFEFDQEVMFVLDSLSDEVEEMIKEAGEEFDRQKEYWKAMNEV
jgi:hypothetical protein